MSSSEATTATIDVGWPRPTNFKIEKLRDLAAISAKISWGDIDLSACPFFPCDPSGGTAESVIYRVLINGRTYLAPNRSFTLALNPGCGESCIKVAAVYDISFAPSVYVYVASDWTDELCVENPPDLYCNKTNNNFTIAKTQNNVSSRMRYALAVKNARAAASYTGTYVGGWGGKFS